MPEKRLKKTRDAYKENNGPKWHDRTADLSHIKSNIKSTFQLEESIELDKSSNGSKR